MMRKRVIAGAIAMALAVLVAPGVSTAGAVAATCAPNADQWLGSYEGQVVHDEQTGNSYDLELDVLPGFDRWELWAEAYYPSLENPQIYTTWDVLFSEGELEIRTEFMPDPGAYARHYYGTSVSCDENGAVTRFSGKFRFNGWTGWMPITSYGSFEVTRA
ncbi:hypothetical protein [Actinophytocola sediminis]